MSVVQNLNKTEEEAQALLSACFDRTVLGVTLVDGQLILRGSVRTFYLKQLAQEQLRTFAKSRNLKIDNRLSVLEIPSDG